MLPAIYHTRVAEETATTGQTTYFIDQTPLDPDFKYEIIAYSQKAGYTLTVWSIGDESERMTGETLWRGDIPILSGGGQLDLYREDTPDSKRLTRFDSANIWDEYATSAVQISDALGYKLRRNLIYL